MCARITFRGKVEEVREEFGIREAPPVEFPPSFNIAPSQDVLAVLRDGRSRLERLRWGLVPPWAKDPSVGRRLINARAETLSERPAFAQAFRKRRCLVVVDGFYEWKKLGGRSVPFFVHMRSDRPFALAGLYELWHGPGGGEALRTCAVVTTRAGPVVGPIHDRMPVIIPPGGRELWLDPEIDEPERLAPLLEPFGTDEMDAYEVSRLVNSPANDSPDCIKPLERPREE